MRVILAPEPCNFSPHRGQETSGTRSALRPASSIVKKTDLSTNTYILEMMHALRSFFRGPPIVTGPLVFHLSEDATFVYDADFAAHKQKVHSGENEYRKRVLFLVEQSRSPLIVGQEKRIVVQNVAHFQQFLGLAPRTAPSRAFHKSLGAKLHVCCASGRTSLDIGLRVVLHEPGLKLVCGHRQLILLGRVGVRHDSPTTRPHREGCNSGTAFVQGSQKLQSGHSGEAHWRTSRLDARLRSARARGTLTSGGQAEKRRCFSRRSPARETKGNAPDGAKRQRRHGLFAQTTTPTGPESRRQGVPLRRRKKKNEHTQKQNMRKSKKQTQKQKNMRKSKT